MRIKHVLTTLVAGTLGLLIASCGSSGQAMSPAPNIPTRNADKAPDVTDEELFDSAATPRPESKPDDDADAEETLELGDDTDLSEDDSEDGDDSEEELDFDEYEDEDGDDED